MKKTKTSDPRNFHPQETPFRRTFRNPSLLLIAALTFLQPAHAGILYTETELWAVGNLWKETRAEWKCELDRHKTRLNAIETSSMPQEHKDFFLQKEARYHRATSQQLAQQRAKVQNVLIDEANARARGGTTAASQEIHATLGTDINDPAHRGIRGDLDAQGGARTIAKMEDTLKDMGLSDLLPAPDQRRPGTLDLGDNFELTIHRTGIEPKIGDEFHHIRNQVDARNPEVYLSERMRDRAAGTKQVGTDYVEVQDHLKKARKGHLASGPELIENPDKLQALAKGTNKTLEMGTLSEDELAAILKKRAIKDSPADFKEKLARLKEESFKLDDPAEAAKIRDASEDIFKSAEQKTYQTAQDEIAAKRKSIEVAEENLKKLDAMADNPEVAQRKKQLRESIDQRRQKFREELIDSQSKMKAARAANHETRPKTKPSPTPDSNQPKIKPNTPDAPDNPKANWDKIKGGGAKAMDAFGAVMDIADIGNACKKFEDYQEGRATSGEVIRAVIDITPIGGVIGAGEKTTQTIDDYFETQKAITAANQQNLEAYLLAWEKQFRQAGLNQADARRYLANAMLSGNLDLLEAKAAQLRAAGKEITPPTLVIDETPGPDGGAWYLWENTKEAGTGMGEGAKTGLEYLITAPGRVVTSFGERELAEANLEYNAATAEAALKTSLFRSLLNAGIDRDQALKAVQDGGSTLRAAAREARENLAQAREKQAAEEAAQLALQEKINAIHQQITALRFMDLTLQTDPASPVPLPRDTPAGQEMELTVSLSSELNTAIEHIRSDLTKINGSTPEITLTSSLNLKTAQPLKPGSWKITLPAAPNLYPLSAQITVQISSLTGDLAPLSRLIERDLQGSVLFRTADESIKLTQPQYHFQNGDYEPITAQVTGQVEGRGYFYHWTIGAETHTTTEPELMFTATLPDPKVNHTTTLTVALCDRANGCILDQASAKITITPTQGTVLIKLNHGGEADGKILAIATCSEVKTFENRTGYHFKPELGQEGYLKFDQFQGQERDRKIHLYGLPHGPYVHYDFETSTFIREEGTYKHGKKHGKWTNYNDYGGPSSGLIDRIVHYRDGKKDGLETIYHDGELSGHANWKEDKKHGETKFYASWAPGGIAEYHYYQNGISQRMFMWERYTDFRPDPASKTLIPITRYRRIANPE